MEQGDTLQRNDIPDDVQEEMFLELRRLYEDSVCRSPIGG